MFHNSVLILGNRNCLLICSPLFYPLQRHKVNQLVYLFWLKCSVVCNLDRLSCNNEFNYFEGDSFPFQSLLHYYLKNNFTYKFVVILQGSGCLIALIYYSLKFHRRCFCISILQLNRLLNSTQLFQVIVNLNTDKWNVLRRTNEWRYIFNYNRSIICRSIFKSHCK